MVGNKKRLWWAFPILLIFSGVQGEGRRDGAFSGLDLEGFEGGARSREGGLLWQDNPFVEAVEDFSVTDLVLTGIVYGDVDRAALINDRAVRKGEKIGSHEVVEVEKNHVVLRNENGLYRLSFTGEAR
ncbi:MAG: hypothetical protein HY538_08910 [Deltaproteobacteria bacterium]|nr:hypothetical protein [Deltaproteobacteria bacterium]